MADDSYSPQYQILKRILILLLKQADDKEILIAAG